MLAAPRGLLLDAIGWVSAEDLQPLMHLERLAVESDLAHEEIRPPSTSRVSQFAAADVGRSCVTVLSSAIDRVLTPVNIVSLGPSPRPRRHPLIIHGMFKRSGGRFVPTEVTP